MQADLIFDGHPELAEGPNWYEGALWWVDIHQGRLNRFNVETGINESRGTGDYLAAALPATNGKWLICGQHKLSYLDWTTGEIEHVATVPRALEKLRWNDAKTDPAGRFWGGQMDFEKVFEASFYRFADGEFTEIFNDARTSNGLAWSKAGDRMFYIDTGTKRVDVFDFDLEKGEATNRRPLVQFEGDANGRPDGMTIDSNDNLWVACWAGHGVRCFDGQTGELLETIECSTANTTSCCFGGENLDTLYITAACEGEARLSGLIPGGGLYAAKPGVTGRPVDLFKA